MIRVTRWLPAFGLVVCLGLSVWAQAPAPAKAPAPASPRAPVAAPVAAPQSVGIDPARLDRLHHGMQALVDSHQAGGIVTLVARDGRVVDVHASGFQDVESRTSMRIDSLFRIASMTKPVTSVAVMMLYEEGKLLLTDPLSKFIPAFKGQKVQPSGPDAAAEPVPARREITIRDLLSHRSGLTYGFLNGSAVGNAYRKGEVPDGLGSTRLSLAQAMDALAAQPLVSQPGAAFNYSLSTDVLGRVVEVVSGQSLDAFFRARIFTPLGMTDTGFDVPAAKWSRLATVYSPDGAGGIRPMKDPESFGNTVMSPIEWYKSPKTYYSGGAGLVSTARDYARFAQMLLNGGTLDGARLLSPKTVDLMTASHTSDIQPGPLPLVGAGAQFGLGFRVVTDVAATQTMGSVGNYGWTGIYGTVFWVDPKEKLVAVMMVQRYPGSPVGAAFQPLVYQSLVR